MKLAAFSVDVLLVHLIRHYQQTFFLRELYNCLDVIPRQDLPVAVNCHIILKTIQR